MRYVSLFSGIEAASVAWQPLGWEAVAFAEIEPFPCEVLAQRFPDGWTDIEYKGKPAPDTARYKALGNSWAVPCARWVGERLQEVDRL